MAVALVVGATGQIGSYLSRCLLQGNYRVIAASRDIDNQNFWRHTALGIEDDAHRVFLAPNDFPAVLSLLAREQPDEIYFLSGQTSVGRSFEQPFETLSSISNATLNFLEAIRLLELEAKFFNAASTDMFGNQPNVVLNEASSFGPVSPYGVAKVSSFWLTHAYRTNYGLFAVNGIMGNSESPLRGPRFVTPKISTILKRIAEGSGEELRLGDTSISRDWLWAPDTAAGIVEMTQADRPDDYVIGSGVSHSLHELIVAIAGALGVKKTPLYRSESALIRPGEISSIRLDPSALMQNTNWSPSVPFGDLARRLAFGTL